MQVIATILAMFVLFSAGPGEQTQTDALAFGNNVSTSQVGTSVS